MLVDSEVLAIRGEGRALEALGLVYTPADYVRRFVGLHDGAFMDQLKADYRERRGGEPPADFEEIVIAGRRKEMQALTIVAGADRALIGARRIAGKIAVASSSRTHYLESKLRRMSLWDYAAPHVYSADLVAHGKPAPDIFLYTAEKLGVAPERCLVVEDSENGVRAGRAAGMEVVGFLGGGHCFAGHGERLTAAGAHRLVASFDDFLASLGA